MDKKLKRLVLVLKMEMALLFADGSRMFHFLHVWGEKKKKLKIINNNEMV